MGADAKAVDTYARLFGVEPSTVRAFLDSGAPAAAAPAVHAPSGPAPGDPGFASSVLGSAPSPPSSSPRPPTGPAPGEPGFDLSQVKSAPSTAPSAPPGAVTLSRPLPAGAGQIDTSGVTPKGFSSGAVTIKNLPAGAGQVDLSGVRNAQGAGQAADDGAAPAGRAAPPPGGTFVPGGWSPSSRSEQRQKGIDPAKLEEGRYFRDVAQGHGMLAADKQMEAEAIQGAADGNYAVAHERVVREAREEQQRVDNERKAYIAAEQTKLNNLSVQAQQKVDPEAAKGSSGAQLMAAIGIAMGQYGASITGGPNAALQIVNANIDRNIRAQEANIANAGKAHDREQSLYHQNLEAFGDRDRAVSATKMQMLDQAKAIADQQYAKAKGSISEANYHRTIESLNNAKAAEADQWTARTEDKVVTEGHEAYHQGGIVGGATHEAKGDAHGYSEELEKAGIPQALAGLQEVDSRLDALGDGDIAGIGGVKNHLPTSVLGVPLFSKEGVANRQAVAHVKNALRKSVAGASLTPGEKAELDKDLEGAGDASSLRNFVHSYRRTLSNQQKNIQAGHSPEGVSLYEQRGGSVKRVEMGKRTAPLQRPVEDDGK